jgi:hypothetical protein
MVKSNKPSLSCPKCSKIYVSQAWFDKHMSKCCSLSLNLKNKNPKNLNKNCLKSLNPTPYSADLLQYVFNFHDDYFSNKTYVPSFEKYLDKLINFGNENNNGLKILHLNVNSLFLKKK